MKIILSVFLLILVLSACKIRNQEQSDSNTNKGDIPENGPATSAVSSNDTWDKSKLDDFILKMESSGLTEVQLGKITQEMAVSTQVRDYGKLMVKDHSDVNEQLKKIALNMKLNIPTTLQKDHQEKIDKLRQKKGKDFDKAYMKEMVDDHKQDIDNLNDAMKKVTDTELKNWITKTLPVLKNHLQKAQEIQNSIKKN